MRMEVDASDYTTGKVLSMECEDGLWRLVAFLSKSLNKMERNYEIHIMGKLVISEIVLFDEPSNKRKVTGGVADVFRW